MIKDILKNLATIIFCVIFSVVFGLLTIPGFTNEINKEISGDKRRECIEILDEKTKRIENKGLILEELTDEEVDYTISKSEIDGYYVIKFNKDIYEVRIYFDNEENIVSVQKEYPEGYNEGNVILNICWLIIFPGIFWLAALGGIGVCIYNIKEIIVKIRRKKKQDEKVEE